MLALIGELPDGVGDLAEQTGILLAEHFREYPADGDHVDIELAPHSLSVLEIGLA